MMATMRWNANLYLVYAQPHSCSITLYKGLTLDPNSSSKIDSYTILSNFCFLGHLIFYTNDTFSSFYRFRNSFSTTSNPTTFLISPSIIPNGSHVPSHDNMAWAPLQIFGDGFFFKRSWIT